MTKHHLYLNIFGTISIACTVMTLAAKIHDFVTCIIMYFFYSKRVGTYEVRGWPTPGKKKKKEKECLAPMNSGDGPRLVKRKRKKEIQIIYTSLGERDKREKSEEKIDCHHQDSNQGPSLVASDTLTTELWCSRHPSRDCSTFSSDFVTHTSCESK